MMLYRELDIIPGYRVGTDGSIWSKLTTRPDISCPWHRTKAQTNGGGYSVVRLRIRGRSKNFSVHRLVAIAFLSNPDGKPEVNHKDGDKSNNRIDNLEWTTRGENRRHAYAIGLRERPLGEKGTASKLTEHDVREIRKLRSEGWTYAALGHRFGVSSRAAAYVISGRTWSHVRAA